MSLARSFTKRLARAESVTSPTRTTSTRKLKPGDISLPVGLLSTTNMLSYDAPTLVEAQKLMALQTTNLPSERMRSTSASSDDAPTSTPSLTDGSSVENSPIVEHNHLSCYFPGPTAPPKRSQSTRDTPRLPAAEPAPSLPKRALSHSKREHERLARKRSLRSSNPGSPTTPSSPRTSSDATAKAGLDSTENATGDLHASIKHAFGQELGQLPEVAEELTVVATDIDPNSDDAYMRQRGLCKFSVNDYLNEIGCLVLTDADAVGCF